MLPFRVRDVNAIPPIDLADLRVLVALAEARHFAKAAKACNLSQPALSARIRRMEEALGTPLVTRDQRFQGFTAAGERMLMRARQILADAHELVREASAGDRLSGRLRLGVIPTATPLAGRLAALMARMHPGVHLQCHSLSSRAIEQSLADFALDAGLTYVNREPVADLRTLALARERYCLVAARELIGDGEGTIDWRDLARLPLALLTPDMQNRRILDRALAAEGVEPTVSFEANSFLAIVGRAAAGDIAAILPRLIVDMIGIDTLHARPLADLHLQPVIGLIMPRREPVAPLAGALWSLAATSLAEPDLEVDNPK